MSIKSNKSEINYFQLFKLYTANSNKNLCINHLHYITLTINTTCTKYLMNSVYIVMLTKTK